MSEKAMLQKIQEFDASDFGLEEADYEKLLEASGTFVTVDCEACDGYYDITLADGTEYAAIAGYHLKGYDNDDQRVYR